MNKDTNSLLTLADRFQRTDRFSTASVLLIATEGKQAFTALQQLTSLAIVISQWKREAASPPGNCRPVKDSIHYQVLSTAVEQHRKWLWEQTRFDVTAGQRMLDSYQIQDTVQCWRQSLAVVGQFLMVNGDLYRVHLARSLPRSREGHPVSSLSVDGYNWWSSQQCFPWPKVAAVSFLPLMSLVRGETGGDGDWFFPSCHLYKERLEVMVTDSSPHVTCTRGDWRWWWLIQWS